MKILIQGLRLGLLAIILLAASPLWAQEMRELQIQAHQAKETLIRQAAAEKTVADQAAAERAAHPKTGPNRQYD